ncbi:Haloacid dehalogenase-like hydrolase, partial [Dillenia turbinata]
MASTVIAPSLTAHSASSSPALFVAQNKTFNHVPAINQQKPTSSSIFGTKLRLHRPQTLAEHKSSLFWILASLPSALLFDCDGILVDTEKDGHRVSFNDTFNERELGVIWDVDLYGELLKIGGGKERMTAYFNKTGWPEKAPKTDEERKEFIASLHKRKTELFMALIEKKLLPLCPGVAKLIDQALASGVQVAVCSTSNEKAVSAIVSCLLGPDRAEKINIFAGDVVPKKKPDPAIYTLGVEPSRCVVIEDSGIGLAAAKSAGMTCIPMRTSQMQMLSLTSLEILQRNDLTWHSVEAFWRSSLAEECCIVPRGLQVTTISRSRPLWLFEASAIVANSPADALGTKKWLEAANPPSPSSEELETEQIASAIGKSGFSRCFEGCEAFGKYSSFGPKSCTLIHLMTRNCTSLIKVSSLSFGEANKCADKLATLGQNVKSGLTELGNPPSELVELIRNDVEGVEWLIA